jgi:hypothetical protein
MSILLLLLLIGSTQTQGAFVIYGQPSSYIKAGSGSQTTTNTTAAPVIFDSHPGVFDSATGLFDSN